MTPKEAKPQPAKTTALAKADQRVHQAESAYYEGRAKREQEMLDIQAGLARCREIELEANMEIAAEQAEREEQALWIAEQNLELRREELALAKKRLQQDKAIADAQRQLLEKSLKLHERELELSVEEFQERRKLHQQLLEWLKEHEANSIRLKLEENRAAWDRENWQGILSRDEVQNILIAGQQRHRLLMLVSPPDISNDCPDAFRNNLQMNVSSELKGFLEQQYPLNSDACPVEFYGKFFKSAIFDAEVKKLEAVLSPVPTVILYSSMTDEKLFLHIGFWGLNDHAAPISLPAWKWEEAMNALAEEGTSEKEQLRQIQRAIVAIHKVIAAALADCYYLAVAPLSTPHALLMPPEEFGVPGMSDYLDELRKRFQQVRDDYQRELAARVAQAEQEERERREREAAEAAQREHAEAARLSREAADREIGRCKTLRDLLEAGKWKEANDETWRLIVGGLKEEQICDLSVAKAIEDLPASEARTMNRLWEEYSQGRFGFRVQQRIYEECQQNFVNFACHVGWRFYYEDNPRLYPENREHIKALIRYSPNALEGHLPMLPLLEHDVRGGYSGEYGERHANEVYFFRKPCIKSSGYSSDLGVLYNLNSRNDSGDGAIFKQMDSDNTVLIDTPQKIRQAISLYLKNKSGEANKICEEQHVSLKLTEKKKSLFVNLEDDYFEKRCLAALWAKCADAPA